MVAVNLLILAQTAEHSVLEYGLFRLLFVGLVQYWEGCWVKDSERKADLTTCSWWEFICIVGLFFMPRSHCGVWVGLHERQWRAMRSKQSTEGHCRCLREDSHRRRGGRIWISSELAKRSESKWTSVARKYGGNTFLRCCCFDLWLSISVGDA